MAVPGESRFSTMFVTIPSRSSTCFTPNAASAPIAAEVIFWMAIFLPNWATRALTAAPVAPPIAS